LVSCAATSEARQTLGSRLSGCFPQPVLTMHTCRFGSRSEITFRVHRGRLHPATCNRRRHPSGCSRTRISRSPRVHRQTPARTRQARPAPFRSAAGQSTGAHRELPGAVAQRHPTARRLAAVRSEHLATFPDAGPREEGTAADTAPAPDVRRTVMRGPPIVWPLS